jgi:hypothetical protein
MSTGDNFQKAGGISTSLFLVKFNTVSLNTRIISEPKNRGICISIGCSLKMEAGVKCCQLPVD